jgi:hypothetical protein
MQTQSNEKPQKLCSLCKSRVIRSVIASMPQPKECIVCYNKKINEQNREKSKKRYVKKTPKETHCLQCNEIFNTNHACQVFCTEVCREKHEITKSNNKWISKNKKDMKITESMRWKQEQGHLYKKKPGFLKKFNAVRG